MKDEAGIKAGVASAIDTLVATLYCPVCKNIISELRADPRINADGNEVPYCKRCDLYWRPCLKKVLLSDASDYVVQVHLHFSTQLEVSWEVEKDEIRLDEADRKNTTPVLPGNQNLQPAHRETVQMGDPVPELNAERKPTDADLDGTGRETNAAIPRKPSVSVVHRRQRDAAAATKAESIYDLAKRFIENDARIQGEFTYPEIEAYVRKARGGYVSADGLYKQIQNLINEGKIKRLQRNRYLRLK